MPRVCAVLGASGFLGSHLVEALIAMGDRVIGLDDFSSGRKENLEEASSNRNFRFFTHDIINPIPLSERVDVVFNAASLASPKFYLANPIQTLLTGSEGSLNAIRLALKNSARYVYFSTSEVYGDPLEHPQREAYWGNVNPVGIRSCYDEAKRFGEALTMAYVREHSLNGGIVRIFNTYGPRLQPGDGRVVSNLIAQTLTQRPMTVYGTGLQTRSFCYVSDLIRAIQKFSCVNESGPINIGNPNEVTIRELALLISEIAGRTPLLEFLNLPQDDPVRRQPDISLAARVIDWAPEITLVKGLELTIDWFQRNLPQ